MPLRDRRPVGQRGGREGRTEPTVQHRYQRVSHCGPRSTCTRRGPSPSAWRGTGRGSQSAAGLSLLTSRTRCPRRGLGALARCSADRRGQLGLDQCLIDRFGCLPHSIADLGDLQRLQHLEQGRLVQGHRVSCPSARTWSVSLTVTRWPPQRGHPRRQARRPTPRPGTQLDEALPHWFERLVGTTSAAVLGSAAGPPPTAVDTGRRGRTAAGTGRHPATAFPAAAFPTAAAPGADRRLVYHVSRASRAICGVNAAMSVPERSR